MLTIATVLRTGGDYEPGHVRALHASVERHVTVPHRTVCLTDSRHVPGTTLPLLRGWPGWWSKIELFDGRLTGDVLYLDLDTKVVGNIDTLAVGHTFTVLQNFWASGRIGSGLMAWGVDLTAIFNRFMEAGPDLVMASHVTTERWGDQGWVRFNSPVLMARWQQVHPNRVVSFKKHCLPLGRVPPGAAIVCFHGQPRPWLLTQAQLGWFGEGRLQQGFQVARA